MESLVRGYQVWWVLDQSVIEDQVRSILVKEIHKLDKLLGSKHKKYQEPAISRNQTDKENRY